MLAILLLAGGLAVRTGIAAQRATARDVCEALSGLGVPADKIGLPTSGARVESGRFVSSTAEGNVNGEYCEVKGWIGPVRTNSPRMQFEVNLPSSWNGKLLQMGGGGFDGSLVTGLGAEGLQPKTVPHPLKRGYVTAGGDGGHQGGPGFDGSFALDQEALSNFGRESIKKVHDVAIAIIMARYAMKPERTYFIGNSQGGHEALNAAALYASDYDGVVANYPAYNVTMLHLASLNVGQAVYSNEGAGWLSSEKTKILTDAVRKACDPLDGATDGIISNIAACHRAFNIGTVRNTLRCSDGQDSGASCLSATPITSVIWPNRARQRWTRSFATIRYLVCHTASGHSMPSTMI